MAMPKDDPPIAISNLVALSEDKGIARFGPAVAPK
jgi:hypothetical protein